MSLWPQYAILALFAMDIGFSVAKHGQPRTGDHSIWIACVTTGIFLWLLYKGGFFDGLNG